MRALKQQLLRYWLAMNASAFDSMAVSLKAFTGGAVAHTLSGDTLPGLNIATCASILAVTFLYGILNFVANNPLEKLFPAPAPGGAPMNDNLAKVNAELETQLAGAGGKT